MKKKLAIKDINGTRVLVETISSFTWHNGRTIRIVQRSGEKMNLNWSSFEAAKDTAAALDKQLEFINL